MVRLLVPAREIRTQLLVVNSRFVTTLAPVLTVEDARAFILRIRAEFADATHNVPAFVIGHGAAVTAHCQDDGEPSGTAGRPALAVLQGSGLGDAAVVVTRYFGGTKLGKGGLVRAYGDAVRSVLRQVPLAEKMETHLVMIVVPYTYFSPVKALVEASQGVVSNEDFAADVTLTIRLPAAAFPSFQCALADLSNGTLEAVIVEANQQTIMPLGLKGVASLDEDSRG